MKKIHYFFLPFLLLFSFTTLQAQSEADAMARSYVSAYDSLLSSYLGRYMPHHTSHTTSFSVDNFDRVPDSVLAHRLNALHTVIPMTYNAVVRSYIRMYLRYMSTRLDVMLSLSSYYHPMFEEELNRYGVPEELKYLTIVESAMNPMATSRAGAAGLWQFMYHTGKLYDLEVNSVVDDRRDPYKSTRAAARFLSDLHSVFGDWTLAIAAYNCGPGNINKAIARSGGLTDFWQIYQYLPRETRGYIPAFIAATYVMNYYHLHGLQATSFDIPIHSDTISVKHDVLFCYVSQACGIEMDELRTLNPQYRIDLIPGASGHYTLNIPNNYIRSFISLEDSVYRWTADSLSHQPVKTVRISSTKAKPAKSARYHTVRRGETLSYIAKKYGTSVQSIKKLNKLRSDKIREGQKLRIR